MRADADAIGVVMIARIDKSGNSSVGSRQLIWLCIALTLCGILVAVMRDYRVLRKYSYVNMVIGLILLLSPMIPRSGAQHQRRQDLDPHRRIFAAARRIRQAVPRVLLRRLPVRPPRPARRGRQEGAGTPAARIKDLGPIIMVWLISMGVLIMQRDLGTSLMFFAMFVAMLYAATGRRSWIVIGFIAFAVGAVAAASVFSHVASAWTHGCTRSATSSTTA